MWKSVLIVATLIVGATAFQVQAQTQDVIVDSVTTSPVNMLSVHVGGRVKVENHAYSYQWPGIYFETRFSGPAVTLIFDDPANNFNVIVDGKPYMILRKPGQTAITLSIVGPNGPHVVRVEKRSETQYATGRFFGFIGQPADPLPSPSRQIEFIGASTVVGYGNTSAFTQCTPDELFETTNAQEGFGPLTAKHFNADYQINAFSGLGMVRNYDGREHAKYHMPMLYERAIFDDPTPVKQPDWHPQVIVIEIGGNDFSTPLHEGEPWHDLAALRADYVRTYATFVKTVRSRNPNAYIILATPPHREEGFAGGTDDVFANIKASGDARIDRVTLPEADSIGCSGHPSIRADARLADFYIQYLTNHPQVWQGK